MNNHLVGLSTSLLLHAALATVVVSAGSLLPRSAPAERPVPLMLAMFQVQPAVVQESPSRAVPSPPQSAKPPRAVAKRNVDRPRRPTPPPTPRVEPAISASAPEPPSETVIQSARMAPLYQPVPQAPDPTLVANYAQILASLIARNRVYPRVAQLRGWQGQVEVQLLIAPGGRLLEVQLSRSSGFDVLDRQALEMVQLARPLPEPPDALRGKEFSVLVPVVFRLRS